MSLNDVRALTFDTGGTILDWHTGISTKLAELGARRGVDGDWATITNAFRQQSLQAMVNHGADGPATKNFDDIHRETLDNIANEFGLNALTEDDRREVWWDTIHNLDCWPDFPSALPRLRKSYFCVSFTILNRSRSRNMTIRFSRVRFDCLMARSRRSSSMARFGNFVSRSW